MVSKVNPRVVEKEALKKQVKALSKRLKPKPKEEKE